MITLVPPGSPPAPAYADAPGGFCWWYADVVDGEGNGVVVIGALGLPFLPGLADAARRGTPTLPRARPAVNLAVYERGRCTWYGLVELASSEAAWSSSSTTNDPSHAPGAPGAPRLVDRATFGSNVFERTVVGDEAVFRAQLDVLLPCGRARGEIVVRGRARNAQEHPRHDVGGDADAMVPRHAWCPQILHARGTVDLVLGDGAESRRVVVDGAGYHDGNGASAPLHDLGIAWWLWGRAAFADEERVLYALWPAEGAGNRDDGGAGVSAATPTAFGVVVDGKGTRVVHDLVLDPLPPRTNWLGMRRVDEVVARDAAGAIFLRARAVHVVDDGPFYTRAVWRASRDAPGDGPHGGGRDGDAVNGVMETVDPRRVDVDWQRPFVRMRVTPPVSSSTSAWHPLFAGDAQGRVGRLVRSFFPRPPRTP